MDVPLFGNKIKYNFYPIKNSICKNIFNIIVRHIYSREATLCIIDVLTVDGGFGALLVGAGNTGSSSLWLRWVSINS